MQKLFDERIHVDLESMLTGIQALYEAGQLSRERYVGLKAITDLASSSITSYTKWTGDRWNCVQIYPESLRHNFTVDGQHLVIVPTDRKEPLDQLINMLLERGIESMASNPTHHNCITVRGVIVKECDRSKTEQILNEGSTI